MRKTFIVKQEFINTFSKSVEDINPIHTGPELAKVTKFGKTLAQGMYGEGYFKVMISENLYIK